MTRAMLGTLSLLWLVVVAGGAASDGALSGVGSWVYQLSGADPDAIAACPADLAVIDPTRDGSRATAYLPEEVARMRARGGGPRLLLAYLSIGEAEDYRDYWRREWRRRPPAWLAAENPDWPGNYKVRYWEPGWQALIMGDARAPLDCILAAGFDGVYLDIIDAYEAFEDSIPDAGERMVAWVARLAAYARQRRPGFLVVAQNGEGLLGSAPYRALLDGVAKEDLWFGMEREQEPSPPAEIAESLAWLRAGRDAGLRVLTVDYVSGPHQVSEVLRRSRAEGFVPTVAVRELDRLVPPPGTPRLETMSGAAPRRDTPGQFYASVLPPGARLLQLGVETWRERLDYLPEGATGSAFRARRFGETMLDLRLSRGSGRHREAGLRVPLALGSFRRDARDQSSGWRDGAALAGVGEVELWLRQAWEPAPRLVLLTGLRAVLPTDRRADPFGSGLGGLLLEAELEHDGELLSVGWQATGGIELEAPLSGSAWTGETDVSCGLETLPGLYLGLSAGVGGSGPQFSLDAERVLGPRDALTCSAGFQPTGAARGRWLGLAWARRLP